MHLNHPQTIPPTHDPQPWKKLSSMKLVPGAKKVGEAWLKWRIPVPLVVHSVSRRFLT